MFPMSNHHFNVEDALLYGVNAAIVLQNIKFWVAHNKANNTNLFDGRHWTYNSYEAFSKLIPYLSAKQIRLAISKLIKSKILLVGNFNKRNGDQTNWYTINQWWTVPEGSTAKQETDDKTSDEDKENKDKIPDGNEQLPSRAEGFAQEGSPLPDSKQQLQNSLNTYLYVDSDATAKKSSPKDDEIVNKVIDLFNSMAKQAKKDKGSRIPIVRGTSPSRTKRIKALSKTTFRTLQAWIDYFNKVFSSSHLIGRKYDWQADLNWLLKEDKVLEILEREENKGKELSPEDLERLNNIMQGKHQQ